MALMKKKSAAAKAGSPPAGGDAAAAAPKKGGKLIFILTPIAVFGGAFGASYLTGSGSAAAPAAAEASATDSHDGHAKDSHGSATWLPQRNAKTLALEPLTITAGTQGQTLRIGLAIEVWDADAEIDVAKLRDAFTTYLRAVEAEMLSDPSFHMRMKRALLHRARVVTGQDIVADVLITDFLLTS